MLLCGHSTPNTVVLGEGMSEYQVPLQLRPPRIAAAAGEKEADAAVASHMTAKFSHAERQHESWRKGPWSADGDEELKSVVES